MIIFKIALPILIGLAFWYVNYKHPTADKQLKVFQNAFLVLLFIGWVSLLFGK